MYNSPIRIHVNKLENRITFKIKRGCYLELLTFETMKLLDSNKSKNNLGLNGKNLSDLEIIELVLVNCNIVNNNYQKNSGILYAFFLNKWFGQLLDIYGGRKVT